MYSNWKVCAILFGGVFALSASAIFVKLAEAPSSVIAFYRLLLAALVLLPFLLGSSARRKEVLQIRRKQWGQIAAAGIFLALHYVLWFESLRFTSTASSTVLVCLQPLFSLLLERVLLKKRPRTLALVGCMVALCGSFVIGFGDFQISGMSLVGDVLALVASAVIAMYFFVGQKVRQEVSAVTYSVLGYFTSAAVLLVYTLLVGESFVGYSGQTWRSFLGLAVICTIGGQFIFNLLLKKVPASAVTMSILGEPIGTCILAYLILHETIGLQQLAGIVVIFVGLTMFFVEPRKKGAAKG